jgi:hypothetical protein
MKHMPALRVQTQKILSALHVLHALTVNMKYNRVLLPHPEFVRPVLFVSRVSFKLPHATRPQIVFAVPVARHVLPVTIRALLAQPLPIGNALNAKHVPMKRMCLVLVRDLMISYVAYARRVQLATTV